MRCSLTWSPLKFSRYFVRNGARVERETREIDVVVSGILRHDFHKRIRRAAKDIGGSSGGAMPARPLLGTENVLVGLLGTLWVLSEMYALSFLIALNVCTCFQWDGFMKCHLTHQLLALSSLLWRKLLSLIPLRIARLVTIAVQQEKQNLHAQRCIHPPNGTGQQLPQNFRFGS
jgi:hypothetical protein